MFERRPFHKCYFVLFRSSSSLTRPWTGYGSSTELSFRERPQPTSTSLSWSSGMVKSTRTTARPRASSPLPTASPRTARPKVGSNTASSRGAELANRRRPNRWTASQEMRTASNRKSATQFRALLQACGWVYHIFNMSGYLKYVIALKDHVLYSSEKMGLASVLMYRVLSVSYILYINYVDFLVVTKPLWLSQIGTGIHKTLAFCFRRKFNGVTRARTWRIIGGYQTRPAAPATSSWAGLGICSGTATRLTSSRG